MIFPALFHTASALSAPTGHLPLEGKALSVVILFSHMRVFVLTLLGKRFSRIVAFPIEEGGPRQRRSGTFVNCLLETISPALFHPAFPIQPPPLRGTSFHRKEGVSTRAPSLGRGCRAQRGGVGFLFGRRSRLLFTFSLGKGFISGIAASSYRSLPHWGRGTAQRWIGCSRKRRT